ncbi:hypothetical protein BTVI_50857 [Pitangus sulphuratus]|nr:hypothetical protein BTVI_50857 [Pitangus sulphuratus]
MVRAGRKLKFPRVKLLRISWYSPMPMAARKRLGLAPAAVGGAKTMENKGEAEPGTSTVTALALPAALPLLTAPVLSVATASSSVPASAAEPAQSVIAAGPSAPAPAPAAPPVVTIAHASGMEPAVASSPAATSSEASMASFAHALRIAPALKRHPSQSRKSEMKTKFQVETDIFPPLPSSGSSSEVEEEGETSGAGSKKAASEQMKAQIDSLLQRIQALESKPTVAASFAEPNSPCYYSFACGVNATSRTPFLTHYRDSDSCYRGSNFVGRGNGRWES